MTAALIFGAVFGLGLYALYRALFPPKRGLASTLAEFDSQQSAPPVSRARIGSDIGKVRGWLGEQLAEFCDARGWQLTAIKADLSLTGKSFQWFLATKCLLAAGALLFIPFILMWLSLLNLPISPMIPLWVGLIFAALFFFLPDGQVRQEAADRRRDFRQVVGSFLDLVAMNLSGGRGVPEALTSASNVGEGWAMRRIRDALYNARITGQTPWEALGRLGDELAVEELRDLSGTLALVADDGAKVRASLTARAATMRRKQLADIEGKAGERSQSMLVAQLLLCTGFLLFLVFPAVMRVMNA